MLEIKSMVWSCFYLITVSILYIHASIVSVRVNMQACHLTIGLLLQEMWVVEWQSFLLYLFFYSSAIILYLFSFKWKRLSVFEPHNSFIYTNFCLGWWNCLHSYHNTSKYFTLYSKLNHINAHRFASPMQQHPIS